MEEYLSHHNIQHILQTIIIQLCIFKPANPIQFIVDYLQKNHLSKTEFTSSSPGFESYLREAKNFSNFGLDAKANEQDSFDLGEDEKPIQTLDTSTSSSFIPEEITHMAPKRRYAISDPPPSGANDVIQLKSEEISAQLENTFKENTIFSHLEVEERRELCNRMIMRKFLQNEEVIRQGEEGDNFYIIAKGECEIFVKSENQTRLVMKVGPQQSFGELALIYNCPRAATVKVSSEEVILYAIDRSTYRRTLMQEILKKRKMYDQFLKGVPLLANLMKYERLTVADALVPCHFTPGQTVVEQGQPGDSFFIILEGKLRVTQKAENGEEGEVGMLGASDYFGEIALLTSAPRAATVTALTNVRCVKLDRKTFTRVMGPCEAILRRNMSQYVKFSDIIEEEKRKKNERKHLGSSSESGNKSSKRQRIEEKN